MQQVLDINKAREGSYCRRSLETFLEDHGTHTEEFAGMTLLSLSFAVPAWERRQWKERAGESDAAHAA